MAQPARLTLFCPNAHNDEKYFNKNRKLLEKRTHVLSKNRTDVESRHNEARLRTWRKNENKKTKTDVDGHPFKR